MQRTGCNDRRGVDLVEDAGHWVRRERPDEVKTPLLDAPQSVR
jgi:hypothetical protein